ncbi:nuclear pore complex protein NUP160-like isoform X1 [Salvia splendens]|uniref:nuclear pore complex protein NUP160-like isoform X1 n=1 Tax=Salvia splendens TaxID=180675 RepID=UPI001C27CDA0|nr:nuclear pore complex protein NUP160-like isoform X1 [Salvia splendens]
MASSSCWRMAGMEAPLLSLDSIEWRQVSVPSTSTYTANNDNSMVKDFASSFTVGNPPSYFIWKISRSQGNVLEIVRICSHKDTSTNGLRLVFPEALFPFAYICKTEYASGDCLVLYTLTISGVAYLIRLRSNLDYGTLSLVPASEVLEYNTQVQPHSGATTAVAAAEGCLLIGRSDGSISCFQLDILNPSTPVVVSELRDDPGFGRLWGILSRSPNLAAVVDLVVSEVQQRKLLFVLHSDGSFRVWDLLSRSKIFGHAMTVPASTGAFIRLWTGEANIVTGVIPLALLHGRNLEVATETIYLYGLRLNVGEKTPLSLEPSSRRISLGEAGPIDVKLTSDKVLILKEDGLIMQELNSDDSTEGLAHYYTLQENLVADLLFQSSEHSSDDLLWLAYSAFYSAKEEITPFLSSVFFHGLFFPGVHCNAVIRQTLADYHKHYTDSEFGSFTVEGLKSEILLLIEYQGGSDSPVSVLQCWKAFCDRYVNNWCKYNAAYGLLMDPSTGAFGIIRNYTISLCRGLEDVEHIIYGSFKDQKNYIGRELDYLGDESSEREILFEFLQCVRNVSQQLGKASSTIFHESLLRTPHISSEEVVPRLLKILETGYNSSTAAILIPELGGDAALEKELLNHRNLRKFSTNIFLSLHELCHRANSWKKVLDVVESYLKFLVPHKIVLKSDAAGLFHLNGSAIVQSMSQIAKMMFDSVLDVFMLLSYMTSISGQIKMSYDDVSRIKVGLIPMIQEIVTEWHIIHYLGTTPCELLAIEDFSHKLSSLQIDCSEDKRLWSRKLGKFEFSLAHILLLDMQGSSRELGNLLSSQLPNPISLVSSSRGLISWIIWGSSGDESSVFFSNSNDLALILLRNNQYSATEYLLTLVDAYSRKEKAFGSLQAMDGKLALLSHLLGCCLVAQTQYGLHGPVKDRKVGEAISCFFRAASMEGSSKAIQSLPPEAGWFKIDFSISHSIAAWKLHYYQWVMQLFEQYNMSEAACQFALAALEQVDESLGTVSSTSDENLGESVTTVKGRLWANVFKFTLDLNNYHDAYCAIISNPDEESKIICLRRFIIVLYERGAAKILCNGQLTLIGLVEKVERELAWKAERSDTSAKPNPFKLLYAFEVHRHNWRKAASYIYHYSVRLRAEAAGKDHQLRSFALQERLNGLAAAINALQLVHPSYAWIDASADDISSDKEIYPNKKARITIPEQSPAGDSLPQKRSSCLDIEKLEKEFVLASAEYLLSLANIKWSFTGTDKPSTDLIDLLVESSSYDMVFTVILKFWKGSGLKRELERVFIAMALKCCPSRLGASFHGKDCKPYGLLLTSSEDDFVYDSLDTAAASHKSAGNSHWGILEHYLDKYKATNPRLPLIVAGTLLSADSQIDLPLWLVRHFKGDRSESSFGMAGNESNPASLFRLYVDHGRHTEATNLLIEYMENLASIRPADIIRRKKPFAIWFPYTYVERLWGMLEESIQMGHRREQCGKLKKLLHGALSNHLHLLKVESDDVKSCAS